MRTVRRRQAGRRAGAGTVLTAVLALVAPVLLGGALVASALAAPGTGAAPAQRPVAATTAAAPSGWLTVDGGAAHTCGLHVGGSLWCWGSGSQGQLGQSAAVTLMDLPRQVGFATWTALAVGSAHTCAVRTGGTLWCWGDNASGQLGTGAVGPDRFDPVQVGTAATWTAVSAGGSHTCGIRAGGTLWCWGANASGELGLGDVTPRSQPTQVPGGDTWVAVSAGRQHTCGLRADPMLPRGQHALSCWGENADGQLGLGDTADRRSPAVVPGSASAPWTEVSTGRRHTCARRSTGIALCWGANDDGQLGVGDTVPRLTPSVVPLSSWTSTATGTGHTCVVRADGSLWCWGSNSSGQLGGGDATDKVLPVQVGGGTSWAAVTAGDYYSCAIRTDGSLWCWGEGGQLGLYPPGARPTPTRVGIPWQSVSPGGHHTCALRTDQSLWCWGANNQYGQLGLGDLADRLTPTEVQPGTTWRDVAAGLFHTCGVRTDGSLWCWGSNHRFALGLGDTANRSVPTRVGTGSSWLSVTASFHTCAETAFSSTGNSVYCWGPNESGQLGVGDTTDRMTPAKVTLPGLANPFAVTAVGTHHTCALGVQAPAGGVGRLWCWGANGDGRLGTGDTANRLSPTSIASSHGWHALAAGGGHTCAIGTPNPPSTERRLYCWGGNFYGQLGIGTTQDRYVPTAVGTASDWKLVTGGGLHTCGIRSATAYCWGSNFEGELGNGTSQGEHSPDGIPGQLFSAVAAGERYTCAVNQSSLLPGLLLCWGDNAGGQLGLGDRVSRLSPTLVPLA